MVPSGCLPEGYKPECERQQRWQCMWEHLVAGEIRVEAMSKEELALETPDSIAFGEVPVFIEANIVKLRVKDGEAKKTTESFAMPSAVIPLPHNPPGMTPGPLQGVSRVPQPSSVQRFGALQNETQPPVNKGKERSCDPSITGFMQALTVKEKVKEVAAVDPRTEIIKEGTRQLDALRASRARSDTQKGALPPPFSFAQSAPCLLPVPAKPGKPKAIRSTSAAPHTVSPTPQAVMAPPPPPSQMIDGIMHHFYQVPAPAPRSRHISRVQPAISRPQQGHSTFPLNVVRPHQRSAAEKEDKDRAEYQKHIEEQRRQVRLNRERNLETVNEFEEGLWIKRTPIETQWPAASLPQAMLVLP